MKRLRIASVCRLLPTPDDPSGGVFVLNRLRALSKRSDLKIVQPVPFFPALRPLPHWAREAAGEVEYSPMFYFPGVLKWLDGRWLARSVRPVLERLHRTGDLDLIDAHFGYPDGVGCVEIGRRLGMPVFVTIRGMEAECMQQVLLRKQLVAALNASAGCISVSHSLRDVVVANGVDPAKVEVIHNAIDGRIFSYGDLAGARQRLEIPAERRLVVSVGSLIVRKRHDIVIRAIAQLRARGLRAQLAIIGAKAFEPDEPQRLRALTAELGVSDVVHFIGGAAQTQIADWLRAADVFALASAREGCCNAVLEALGVGAPAVVTAAGDNAYFVRDRSGYVTPVDDAAAFADSLERALRRDDWDRPAISRHLQEQVGDWDSVAARVEAFYRRQLALRSSANEPLTGRRTNAA